MEYIADLADKSGKGQGSNLYGGKPEERPFVRAIANAVCWSRSKRRGERINPIQELNNNDNCILQNNHDVWCVRV